MYAYTQLKEAQVHLPSKQHTESRLSAGLLVIINVSLGLIALLALLGFTYHEHQTSHAQPQKRDHSCSCGRSSSEALQNGCKYDPYAAAWLPDHCRDDNLIEQFTVLGREQGHNWTFYDIDDRGVQLSVDETAARASVVGVKPSSKVATTMDWHHSHCVYLWLSLHVASQREDLSLAPRYRKDGHVWHCARRLLQLVAAFPLANDTGGVSEVDVYY